MLLMHLQVILATLLLFYGILSILFLLARFRVANILRQQFRLRLVELGVAFRGRRNACRLPLLVVMTAPRVSKLVKAPLEVLWVLAIWWHAIRVVDVGGNECSRLVDVWGQLEATMVHSLF